MATGLEMKTKAQKRAVFLDRDGVLIETEVRGGRPYAITAPDQMRIFPGVAQALERLGRHGFLTIVATNQPDVARGNVPRRNVEIMHERLMAELALDDIRVCYETDGPNATCYKPLPKMLLDAADRYDIDLTLSFMVGDRWRDIGAGLAAGCFSIFIERGYSERRPDQPDATVRSLPEAVDVILSNPRCQIKGT